jgi:hypothetical protein
MHSVAARIVAQVAPATRTRTAFGRVQDGAGGAGVMPSDVSTCPPVTLAQNQQFALPGVAYGLFALLSQLVAFSLQAFDFGARARDIDHLVGDEEQVTRPFSVALRLLSRTDRLFGIPHRCRRTSGKLRVGLQLDQLAANRLGPFGRRWIARTRRQGQHEHYCKQMFGCSHDVILMAV